MLVSAVKHKRIASKEPRNWSRTGQEFSLRALGFLGPSVLVISKFLLILSSFLLAKKDSFKNQYYTVHCFCFY